jgi:hypothetical protein
MNPIQILHYFNVFELQEVGLLLHYNTVSIDKFHTKPFLI